MAGLNNKGGAIVRYAENTFGARLTSFLLCGLGGTEDVPARTFHIEWEGRNGKVQSRIRAVTAHPEGLPRGDHPLVMLALLRLALESGLAPGGCLEYGHGDVYDLLGWEASEEAQTVVDEAVERYFQVVYKVESIDAKTRVRMACGMLTGYTSQDDSFEGPNPFKRFYREVSFDRELLEELITGMLFGIEWRRVSTMQELSRGYK